MVMTPVFRDILIHTGHLQTYHSARYASVRRQHLRRLGSKIVYPLFPVLTPIANFMETLEKHDGWSDILITYADSSNFARVEVVYTCSGERKAATISYHEHNRESYVRPVTLRESRYKIITNESLVLYETVYITPSMGPREILAQIRHLCPSMMTYECVTENGGT